LRGAELSFNPARLPCEPCARLEDLLLLAPPPASLVLAMVRPLKPAPLLALRFFDELDLLKAAVPPARVLEREKLSLLETPIEALLPDP
jgi:hypothetical protein